MLEIKNLKAYYGVIEGLKGIDINVGEAEIISIIGSNGAGKTTLLKAISGSVATSGSIKYRGEEISGLKPKQTANLGIIHCPEGRHIFPGLSVAENLEMGTVAWGGVFGKGGKQAYEEELQMIYETFPRLDERRKQLGWSLSGGEQQMLAIGRAIMSRPKLLMLDEPSMGLAPLIVDELYDAIKNINKKHKIPILLVEQNARKALSVADSGYILEQGLIVKFGSASDLSNDPAVLEAYFGKAKH
ncbi:MAG TPA: ABC transporter ATP-binding protein [Clostridiaceae bacterium]|nr:ABC transporter ATP-binding protein [Clostridiaceae bacterium]